MYGHPFAELLPADHHASGDLGGHLIAADHNGWRASLVIQGGRGLTEGGDCHLGITTERGHVAAPIPLLGHTSSIEQYGGRVSRAARTSLHAGGEPGALPVARSGDHHVLCLAHDFAQHRVAGGAQDDDSPAGQLGAEFFGVVADGHDAASAAPLLTVVLGQPKHFGPLPKDDDVPFRALGQLEPVPAAQQLGENRTGGAERRSQGEEPGDVEQEWYVVHVVSDLPRQHHHGEGPVDEFWPSDLRVELAPAEVARHDDEHQIGADQHSGRPGIPLTRLIRHDTTPSTGSR